MDILLVDDEAILRSFLQEYLETQGHTVRCCENGLQAWETLMEEGAPYNVVLADVKMPVMDGRELLRRAKEHHVQVPIILISGQIRVDEVDAVQAGARCIIHKPFTLNQIADALAALELES